MCVCIECKRKLLFFTTTVYIVKQGFLVIYKKMRWKVKMREREKERVVNCKRRRAN